MYPVCPLPSQKSIFQQPPYKFSGKFSTASVFHILSQNTRVTNAIVSTLLLSEL